MRVLVPKASEEDHTSISSIESKKSQSVRHVAPSIHSKSSKQVDQRQSKKSEALPLILKRDQFRVSDGTDDAKMLVLENNDEDVKRTETFYLANQEEHAQSVKTATVEGIQKPTVAIAATRKLKTNQLS